MSCNIYLNTILIEIFMIIIIYVVGYFILGRLHSCHARFAGLQTIHIVRFLFRPSSRISELGR